MELHLWSRWGWGGGVGTNHWVTTGFALKYLELIYCSTEVLTKYEVVGAVWDVNTTKELHHWNQKRTPIEMEEMSSELKATSQDTVVTS